MRSKKLLICFVFLFVSLFAFNFNVKAATYLTSGSISVTGAQVRTSGNAGIRFVATETYEGEDSYGILLAFGEAEADENFVVGGTVNEKAVGNASVATAEEGVFKVTLWNIPEAYYTQKISARAYVVVAGEYVYSSTVTVRSLADVVEAAYKEGNESEFVKNVYDVVSVTTLHYAISAKYDSFDDFVTDIVNDFNSTGKNDALKTTISNFVGTTHPNVKYVFNNTEKLEKYKWLIELALADVELSYNSGKTDAMPGTYTQCFEMYNKMLNGDTSAISGSYADARTCFRQFIHSIINKCNPGSSGKTAYKNYISDYSLDSNLRKVYTALGITEKINYELNAQLPVLTKVNYTFVGWYDNPEFTGEVLTAQNNSRNYYAKFVPVE